MDSTNWLKQSADEPLFSDLLWSRPENKAQRGKLLVIGGSSANFSAPATAHSSALSAGIGTARVLLPAALKKTVGPVFPGAEFSPNNPSGSYSRASLGDFLENADWSDAVLLAGDLGKNSETAIVLDSFLDKYSGLLCLSGDSIDYFEKPNSLALSRDNTLIVATISQLQKLAKANRPSTPILNSMNLSDLVSVLADWTNSTPVIFATYLQGSLVVAYSGRVCSTTTKESPHWQTEIAAHATTWWLQNPSKPLEAVVTAVYSYIESLK